MTNRRLSLREVAEITGDAYLTLLDKLEKGSPKYSEESLSTVPPVKKIGGRWRIWSADLYRFLDRLERGVNEREPSRRKSA
jgi:hypothetical protein